MFRTNDKCFVKPKSEPSNKFYFDFNLELEGWTKKMKLLKKNVTSILHICAPWHLNKSKSLCYASIFIMEKKSHQKQSHGERKQISRHNWEKNRSWNGKRLKKKVGHKYATQDLSIVFVLIFGKNCSKLFCVIDCFRKFDMDCLIPKNNK